MEDLIPFLIFIVIALVNFVKYASKKSREGKSKPAPAPPETPQQQPSSLEDFFEKLASNFEPQPTEPTDWPESVERPDYMKEMETFEAPVSTKIEAEETAEIIPMPSPNPMVRKTPDTPSESGGMDQVAALKSAMKAMPALLSNSKSMRISSPPILRSSSAGRNNFPLKERATLRRAVLANLVFSQPRVYDVSFDNSIIP